MTEQNLSNDLFSEVTSTNQESNTHRSCRLLHRSAAAPSPAGRQNPSHRHDTGIIIEGSREKHLNQRESNWSMDFCLVYTGRKRC